MTGVPCSRIALAIRLHGLAMAIVRSMEGQIGTTMVQSAG